MTDSARTTTLPATRFEVATVEGVLPSEQAVASTQEIQTLLAPEPLVDQAMIDAQAEAEVIEIDSGLVRWMQWLFALLVSLLSSARHRRFGAMRANNASPTGARRKRLRLMKRQRMRNLSPPAIQMITKQFATHF
jgi:hypothetical protein